MGRGVRRRMGHVRGFVRVGCCTRDALLLGFSVRCLTTPNLGGFTDGLESSNFTFQTLDFPDCLVKIST